MQTLHLCHVLLTQQSLNIYLVQVTSTGSVFWAVSVFWAEDFTDQSISLTFRINQELYLLRRVPEMELWFGSRVSYIKFLKRAPQCLLSCSNIFLNNFFSCCLTCAPSALEIIKELLGLVIHSHTLTFHILNQFCTGSVMGEYLIS